MWFELLILEQEWAKRKTLRDRYQLSGQEGGLHVAVAVFHPTSVTAHVSYPTFSIVTV